MAHEKANLVCDDMCMVEGVSKEEFNSKIVNYKLKDDFAILTGSMTVEAGASDAPTNAILDVNYPSGFDKSNCVVLSTMTTNTVPTSTTYSYPHNLNVLDSEMKLTVMLGNDVIQISVGNTTSAKTFNYKIVLMKI